MITGSFNSCSKQEILLTIRWDNSNSVSSHSSYMNIFFPKEEEINHYNQSSYILDRRLFLKILPVGALGMSSVKNTRLIRLYDTTCIYNTINEPSTNHAYFLDSFRFANHTIFIAIHITSRKGKYRLPVLRCIPWFVARRYLNHLLSLQMQLELLLQPRLSY